MCFLGAILTLFWNFLMLPVVFLSLVPNFCKVKGDRVQFETSPRQITVVQE